MPKCVGLTNNPKTIGCIYIYGLTDAIAKNKWTLFANKFTNKLDFREKQSTLSPGKRKTRDASLAGVKKGRFGTNSSAKASDLSSLTSTWIFQSYSHVLMVLWDFYILSTPRPLYIYIFVGTLKSVQVCDFGNTDWWIMWMCMYIYIYESYM